MVLAYVFPSPTGFFFISIVKPENCYPCGTFPSPLGSFFISMQTKALLSLVVIRFRPLWGAFLFLPCPMETLAGIEKTCTLRCKKFSPVKSGDSKLLKCSDPWFYALRCKTTILLALSSPFLDHRYDLTEGRLVLFWAKLPDLYPYHDDGF